MKQIKFSENLKNLRLSAKMTQRQLAGILGVKQSTVSVWEKRYTRARFFAVGENL